jgi:hypothetical protein
MGDAAKGPAKQGPSPCNLQGGKSGCVRFKGPKLQRITLLLDRHIQNLIISLDSPKPQAQAKPINKQQSYTNTQSQHSFRQTSPNLTLFLLRSLQP